MGGRKEDKAEKQLGEWSFDPRGRTAIVGDLLVEIVPQPDGTFVLRYSGNIPLEDQIRISREVLQAVEMAQGVTVCQKHSGYVQKKQRESHVTRLVPSACGRVPRGSLIAFVKLL